MNGLWYCKVECRLQCWESNYLLNAQRADVFSLLVSSPVTSSSSDQSFDANILVLTQSEALGC